MGTYAYVNPVVAVLVGYFLGGEPIGLRTMLGTVFVLVSVVVITTTREKKPAGARIREGGTDAVAANIQERPGSALLVAGLIGFALGVIITKGSQPSPPRRHRRKIWPACKYHGRSCFNTGKGQRRQPGICRGAL